MKKSKLLIVGLIGLLMVLGVILFGCTNERCDGDCIWWGRLADKDHKDKFCNPYGNGGACFNSCDAYNKGGDAVLVFLPVECDCK